MYRIIAQGELIINFESAGILISIDRDKYSIFERARTAAEKQLKDYSSVIIKTEENIHSPEIHFMSDGNRLKVSSKLLADKLPAGKVAAISLVMFAIISIVDSIKGEDFIVNDENNFTKVKNVEIVSIEKV
ncbi:MAG: hypothetical protein ACYCT2_06110 [Thermoplasmataceae archaeon]